MQQYTFPTSLLLLASLYQAPLEPNHPQTSQDTTHLIDVSTSPSTSYLLLRVQHKLYSIFSTYHTVICTLEDAHGTQSNLVLTPTNHSDFVVQVRTDNPEVHPLLSKIPTTVLHYNPDLDEDSQNEVPLYSPLRLTLQETHTLLQQHISDVPPDAITIWPHPLTVHYDIPWLEVDSRSQVHYTYTFSIPQTAPIPIGPSQLEFHHSAPLHSKLPPVLYVLRNSILFDHVYRYLQASATLLYNRPRSDYNWTPQPSLTKAPHKVPPHPSPCCTFLLQPQRILLAPTAIYGENPEGVLEQDAIRLSSILPPENDPPSNTPISLPQLQEILLAKMQTIHQQLLSC